MQTNTLTQQLIQDILEYIRSNNLKAGDSLPTEDRMRELFDVSRVSLREACSYLKGIGLITSRRGSAFRVGKGDFVATLEKMLRQISYFDQEHLTELLELRKTLEIGSVYNSVLNADADDIARIFSAVDKMDELGRLGKVADLEYLAAESEFHQAIIRPAQCRMLGIINTAVGEFFNVMKHNFQKHSDYEAALITARRSNLEHRQIAIAFKLCQPEAALLALTKHLAAIDD